MHFGDNCSSRIVGFSFQSLTTECLRGITDVP